MTTLAHALLTVHSLPSPFTSRTLSVCRGEISSIFGGVEVVF